MKKAITIISLLLLGASIHAQDTVKVNLYRTTDDYRAKTFSNTNVPLIVKKATDEYILIKKFVDSDTKEFKKAHTSWALSYNGNTYVNLLYSSDLGNGKLFLKFDIEGQNFCANFIEDSTANVIKNSGAYYGGGLQGALIKESTKWGKNFKTKDDRKVKIHFFNLNWQYDKMTNRPRGSVGYYISRKELNKQLDLNLSKEDLENLTFEDAIVLLNKKNK